jgi:hypothetical protein
MVDSGMTGQTKALQSITTLDCPGKCDHDS